MVRFWLPVRPNQHIKPGLSEGHYFGIPTIERPKGVRE
jgi:hypothetical protein